MLVICTHHPLGRKVVEVMVPDILRGELEQLNELSLLSIALGEQLFHLTVSLTLD
jgi:hypothetical protein